MHAGLVFSGFKRRLLPVLVLLCFSTVARGQLEKEFIPSPFLDTIPPVLKGILTKKVEADKAKLRQERNKISDYAGELLDDRMEMVVDYFNKDYFIMESNLAKYLASIQARITQANPGLPDSLFVLPFRSPSANAVNFGNGFIGYMLGLLARSQNEDQVAFVICHEIAHSVARHSENSILSYARLNYDKDLKKQINQVKRSEYLQYSRLKEIMKNLKLSMNRHSREHEFEADSLALIFYLRAGYRPEGSLETMDVLDGADSSLYKNAIDLRKHFTFRDFPFKDSWLSYTAPTAWIRSSGDAELDTSRTHPDCMLRKESLRRQLLRKGIAVDPHSRGTTSVVHQVARFEVVESAIHFKKYGLSLYMALQLLREYPSNAYLHGQVVNSLFQIYLSQKAHELGKVVELPDSRFGDPYNRFLTFIHQLRLSELSFLAYHYAIAQDEATFANEHFLYSLWLVSQLEVSQLDPVTVKEDYVSRFPDGRYLPQMKTKLNLKR